MGSAHLEKEAEHPVEADLERGDPGSLDLPGLILRDPGLAAVGELAESVELAVEAGPDKAPLPGKHGTALAERGC